MTSRLDRLFVLLEAGSSAATRRVAARQLGEVQKAHPEELHKLLARLMKYLLSPAWDTRIAASQAVESILSNVPEWQPPTSVEKDEPGESEENALLRCETFDIETVLLNGAHLMGSEGHEYDMEDDSNSADAVKNLAAQRLQLNTRLGLDVASKLGMDLSSVYTNEDLCPLKVQPNKSELERRPVQELVQQQSKPSKPLSSRELNLAKRKARQAFCKQKSRDCSTDESTPSTTPPIEPDKKRPKLDLVTDLVFEGPVPDGSPTWGDCRYWPLRAFCRELQAQLCSGAWEARHGAAAALRSLLAARPAKNAVSGQPAPDEVADAHQEWLEDMALRLLCVLALDRFGDFVSDQVVAPVRETCAQTLGVALAQMRAPRVAAVARLLATLAAQAQWEARHGALLAFKYLLAARQEVACSSGALQHLIVGLSDAAEDVSAVAAGALLPAARALCERRPGDVREVVARLWRLLREQDDLAAPANAYMALLAALMALPEAAPLLHPVALADVLPRLWPYLDHASSSVRKASLQTLRTLTRPLALDESGCAANGDGGEQSLSWTPELLQEAMRLIYQRVLFEHVRDIQEVALQVWENLVRYSPLGTVLVSACPLMASWLCLAMQPPLAPAPAPATPTTPLYDTKDLSTSLASGGMPPEARLVRRWYIGGSESQPSSVRDGNVTRARCLAANVLGYLSCYLVLPAPGIEYKDVDESPIDCYVKVMIVYIRSGSALQRLVAALVIAAWARRTREMETLKQKKTNGNCKEKVEIKEDSNSLEPTKQLPPLLVSTLHTALNQSLYYDEVAFNCNRILQEARDLHAMMKHYKLPVDGEEFNSILRLEQVLHLTTITQPMLAAMKSKRISQTLEERRKSLHSSVTQCSIEQSIYNVSVQASLAAACVNLHALPEKLNPVVRPLMESIKKEPSEELQHISAHTLAELLSQLVDRETSPNNKVLANLKAFLRCDPEYTPRVGLTGNTEEINGDSGSGESGLDEKNDNKSHGPDLDKLNGILTLWELTRDEKPSPKRGRPPANAAVPVPEDIQAIEDEGKKSLRIQRRGATLALTSLAMHFGVDLPDKLPKLWEYIAQPFELDAKENELESAEETVSRLSVFEAVCGALASGLWARAKPFASACARLCAHRLTAVRHMAARCLAAMAERDPDAVMSTVVNELVPRLSCASAVNVRCGAAEGTWRVVRALRLRAVPYSVLLVVPLLGRMSDHFEPVRLMSTHCFAALIQLMPLDGAVPEPPSLSPELRARRQKDKVFLEQLFNPKSIKDYKIPVPVCAELRSYQQAGINWLRFLHEYKLHGVLCDDMGLGKTLQSIVVMAGSHWEQSQDKTQAQLPSLVVCPPTLTGHWMFEVSKFIPSKFLKPLQYVGPPVERERLRSQLKHYNLFIASYDILKKDIDFFSSIKWNYCILDEGHIIKNGKTKIFKAIKQLVANHRLILSGTPIQNNVLELWSLFEFLMPGLLGSAKQFSARYSRAILQAREPRASTAVLQAAVAAADQLHRQVLPFLLRRVKEDVLKELPPKITQDYYCELSPLQRRLYENLARAHDGEEREHTHVFQALHYLQKVCNHPKLVLTPEHPEAQRIGRELLASRSSLEHIEHSAKLPALKQLLLDCGIGVAATDAEPEVIVSQHRALIFCQLKKMLDIVEKDLLRKHLPLVTYLRLDGSVPAVQRHSIVTRFNEDVSIDVLLLTTAVGGLGLNLTGADTVIFVEHDWNPTKDLQAMDRAHRIGQKRSVNVYRLITRDTIEEKIMGLQKFKLMTANTVINSENTSLETMGTEQLLDLFQMSESSASQQPQPGPSSAIDSLGGLGIKSVIETLPELWDDKQYEEEYDMSNFIVELNKMNKNLAK